MPLIALILQTLLCAFGVDFFLPSFPLLEKDFQVPASSMHYLIGGYTLGALIIRIILGPLYHFLGLRVTIFLMGSIGIGGQLLCGMATHFSMLIICRVIHGIGLGGIFTLLIALFPQFTKTRIIGYNAGFITFNVGVILGPLIAAFLLESWEISWRTLFYLSASLQICVLPLFLIFNFKETQTKQSVFKTYRTLLFSPAIMLNILWGGLNIVQYLTYLSQIPHAVIATMGYSSSILSIVLLLSSLSSIVFGIAWNKILQSSWASLIPRMAFILNGSLLLLSYVLFKSMSSMTLLSLMSFILLQNLTASLVLPLSLSQATEAMTEGETEIINFASILRSFLTYVSTTACAFFIEETPLSLYTLFFITSLMSFTPAFLLYYLKKDCTLTESL